MAISSGILLPAVPENPTFLILSALAYTTGLGYRPTCDTEQSSNQTDSEKEVEEMEVPDPRLSYTYPRALM